MHTKNMPTTSIRTSNGMTITTTAAPIIASQATNTSPNATLPFMHTIVTETISQHNR